MLCLPWIDPANVTIIPEVLVAAFDEEAVFTCIGFGIPLPTLSWARVGSDVPLIQPKFEEEFYNTTNDQGYAVAIIELKIYDTNSNDEGLYKCVGNNAILNLIDAQAISLGRFLIEGKLLWT